MKCEHCNKNEATTFIRQNINGKVTEMHLCGECARKMGLVDDFEPENFFAHSLLGNLLGAGAPSMNFLSGVDRCPSCGSTFSDIVKNGLVGCSDCYSKFASELEPSIIKLHGKTRHIGKNIDYVKTEDGDSDSREEHGESKGENIDSLKQQLSSAIKEQRFEDAAVLRDKINEMQNKGNK